MQPSFNFFLQNLAKDNSKYLGDFFFVSIIITTFVQRNGAIVLSST